MFRVIRSHSSCSDGLHYGLCFHNVRNSKIIESNCGILCAVIFMMLVLVPTCVIPQAQGGMINMKKRKPVGVAFHWFLPKPFGAEARKSRLSPNDPMRFTHKAYQSSPMFVDLAAPERQDVELPSEDTEVRGLSRTLQRYGEVARLPLSCLHELVWNALNV